tara:strand:- start:236 stop:652 length:417 start_codon:yes stop_codon:yes gene_type:complete
MRINMKRFTKKCSYCKDRFATHPARKIHETMMHREKLIKDGVIVIGKTTKGSKYHYTTTRGRRKTIKPMVFSTTPHIGSVECVIESDNNDGTIVINPTKKYPRGKVFVWSHVHGNCTRDPCLFCGRGDFKKEWGIKDD